MPTVPNLEPMPDLWSPSSWTSKPIAQVSRFLYTRTHLITSRMLPIQINIIFQSMSSSSSSLPINNVLSFQSPFKAFNPSPNRNPLRGRSHRFRKKATWISAEIDVFLCSRSNVYAISSASFNATRPFCFTLVTVLKASTPVPTYVSSNSYVTYPHLIYPFSSTRSLDENRRTSPRKSDSSSLFL